MYQSIFINKKDELVYLWDDERGMTEFPLKSVRYAYRKSQIGTYKSLYGDKLERVYDYSDHDTNLFESDVQMELKVLTDVYSDSDEPSKGHRILAFDIEVDSTGGFPDIAEGDKEITAIAIYDFVVDKYICYVLDREKKIADGSHDNVTIQSFRNEENLLETFLNKWKEINPTIVTGWNSNGFDIPYIFNRIRAVLGKRSACSLSPVGIAYQNKFNKRMVVAGINCLDYMELYKKFLGVMRPSYALGAVARDEELKTQKLTYRGSLNDLYKTDLNRYVEYNLADVKIIVELDKKYDFLYLARSVCHKGHIPYEWFQMSSRFIDGAILMYLHRHNLIAPNKPIGGREEYEEMEKEGEDGFIGAYVKEPIPNLYDWIYSADITSLYPSIIMSLNISPETKIGKIEKWDYDEFQNGNMSLVKIGATAYTNAEFKKMLDNNVFSVSSNGIMFRQDIEGVVPKILDMWFSERVEYRELAKKHKKEGDVEKAAFYGRRQLRQKIFLNCFSPDTNVMTPMGIKSITDFKEGDLVYSLNKESGITEIRPVTRIYEYDYCGDMIHFCSHHYDFLVTPNHKFWVSKLGKQEYKSFKWETASDIISDKVRRKFPIISQFPSLLKTTASISLEDYAKIYKMDFVIKNNKIRIRRPNDNKQGRHTTYIPVKYDMDDWLEFLGWYISKGSLYTSIPKKYENGNSRGISYKIHIAQEKFQSDIISLLDRMKLPYYMDDKGFSISNDIIYHILEQECGKYSENKSIPGWVFELPTSQLKYIYKTLMLGDGHIRGNCYTTKSLLLKNDFIRLCLHIGENYAYLRDYDGCYRIQINSIRGKGPTLKHTHRKIVPYIGKVYCIEVDEHHTILCGRNDKYQWTGQSVYGTLGLPVFRFYDRDNAEATTVSGQYIIKSAEKLVNDIYHQKFKDAGKVPTETDFVKYVDTDSVYLSSVPLAMCEATMPTDMKQFTIDSVTLIAGKINELYKEMVPRVFNISSERNRIKIVGDVIAKKAMWIAKKRYAMLKVFDMESMSDVKDKNGNEGKIEIKGIDIVRSSWPTAFKKIASSVMDMLLRGVSKIEIDEKILSFEENIDNVPYVDLGKTTSVKFVSQDGEKNYNPLRRNPFQYIKGTPIGVKSALAYNDLIKLWKLDLKVEPIHHGQKVKWVYLVTNEFNIDTLAMKGDDTDPDEILNLISKCINRELIYDSELKSKLMEFYEVIRWEFPRRNVFNIFESDSSNEW